MRSPDEGVSIRGSLSRRQASQTFDVDIAVERVFPRAVDNIHITKQYLAVCVCAFDLVVLWFEIWRKVYLLMRIYSVYTALSFTGTMLVMVVG